MKVKSKYKTTLVQFLFMASFIFLIASGKVMLWLSLFAASLIAGIIFGRVYCGYVCPMNTLMILTAWLSKKLKIQTVKAPGWLKNGHAAWAALIISAAAMLLSKRLLHTNLPILPVWLALSVLITLRYEPSVFHNLICPFGALQKTFGKHARFSKLVDKDACIGCKLCEKACPSAAILVSKDVKKAIISPALCHQCTNCQEVCPTNAIHYRKISS